MSRRICDDPSMTFENITPERVLEYVDMIRGWVNDPEMAHSAEDNLSKYVLATIALGHPRATELAKAVIRTHTIAFPRRCA